MRVRGLLRCDDDGGFYGYTVWECLKVRKLECNQRVTAEEERLHEELRPSDQRSSGDVCEFVDCCVAATTAVSTVVEANVRAQVTQRASS